MRAATNTFPIHNDLLISFDNETSQCFGDQKFEYAVYIGKPDMSTENVIAESRRYTVPVISAELGAGTGGVLGNRESFVRKENDSVTVSCLKKAWDCDKSLIMRLCNPTGTAQCEKITFSFKPLAVSVTDMLENPEKALSVTDGSVETELAPYKIVTLKIDLL